MLAFLKTQKTFFNLFLAKALYFQFESWQDDR